MGTLAATFGTGQVFWSMLWFFLFFIWIWLLIIGVRRHLPQPRPVGLGSRRSGRSSSIFMPYLGVFVYLIARGGKMHEHAVQSAQAQDAATKAYIRSVAASSPADQVAKLANLKAQGVIDDAEFERMKAKAIAG